MHVDRGWIVVARSLGGENGKLAFNECRLSGRGDESSEVRQWCWVCNMILKTQRI